MLAQYINPIFFKPDSNIGETIVEGEGEMWYNL